MTCRECESPFGTLYFVNGKRLRLCSSCVAQHEEDGDRIVEVEAAREQAEEERADRELSER